jgi:hypothetical protein
MVPVGTPGNPVDYTQIEAHDHKSANVHIVLRWYPDTWVVALLHGVTNPRHLSKAWLFSFPQPYE